MNENYRLYVRATDRGRVPDNEEYTFFIRESPQKVGKIIKSLTGIADRKGTSFRGNLILEVKDLGSICFRDCATYATPNSDSIGGDGHLWSYLKRATLDGQKAAMHLDAHSVDQLESLARKYGLTFHRTN